MQNVIESSYIDRDTHRYYGVESDKKNGNGMCVLGGPIYYAVCKDLCLVDYYL